MWYESMLDALRLSLHRLSSRKFSILAFLLVLQLVWRVTTSTWTVEPEVRIWFRIANDAVEDGKFLRIYSTKLGYDYPPLWLVLISIVYMIYPTRTIDDLGLILIKMPLILADFVLVLVVYRLILAISGDERYALLGAVLYLLDANAYHTCTIAGMFDGICSLFIVLSFLFLIQKRLDVSALSMGAACFTKQLALPPTAALVLYTGKAFGWRKGARFLLVLVLFYLGASLPWLYGSFDDYITALIYVPPSRAESFTLSHSLWGLFPSLDRNLSIIAPDWLIQTHFYIFYLSLLATLVVIYDRKGSYSPKTAIESMFLMFSAFLIFSPKVYHHYYMIIIPFLIVDACTQLHMPIWYLIVTALITLPLKIPRLLWEQRLILDIVRLSSLSALFLNQIPAFNIQLSLEEKKFGTSLVLFSLGVFYLVICSINLGGIIFAVGESLPIQLQNIAELGWAAFMAAGAFFFSLLLGSDLLKGKP